MVKKNDGENKVENVSKPSVVKSSLYGFVLADAMGVPVEFCIRERLLNHPVTKMIGYGSHDVPAGTWSDAKKIDINTTDHSKSLKHQLTTPAVGPYDIPPFC